MITDEKGVRHPECVADEMQLRVEEARLQRVEKVWNRKAAREGWQRKSATTNSEEDNKEQTGADHFFARKAAREGWGRRSES